MIFRILDIGKPFPINKIETIKGYIGVIGDDILGWDPVRNIQESGSAFIGVIALVVLYLLFINKKKN